MFTTDFQIDGVNYQLSANCHQVIWPRLCDRVIKHLERIGKVAAKNQFGQASSTGVTRMNNELLQFKLIINPEGFPIGTNYPR